jgi:hypothetical protein
VTADEKPKPGSFASTGNHPLITCHAERRTPL